MYCSMCQVIRLLVKLQNSYSTSMFTLVTCLKESLKFNEIFTLFKTFRLLYYYLRWEIMVNSSSFKTKEDYILGQVQ